MVARLTAALAAGVAIAASCAQSEPSTNDADAHAETRFEPGPRPAQSPASLLPYPAFDEWSLAREIEVFSPGSLDELVGPGASAYRRYGCTAAAVAEYRRDGSSDSTLRLAIFEMRSRLDAFGVLAEQIASSEDPAAVESPGVLEIREAGVIGPGRVTFFDGPHLVDIVLEDVSSTAAEGSREENDEEQLAALARRLAVELPGESTLPAELTVLPRERRVRRSERYDPDHLMGLQALGPGVSALYGDPGPRYRVGVALGLEGPSAQRARDDLAALVEERTEVAGLGDGAMRGELRGRGTLLVAVQGATVAVALIEAGRPLPERVAAATLALALQPVATRPRAEDPRPWRRGETAIAAPLEHDAGARPAGSRR
jgi:hypothetical protein